MKKYEITKEQASEIRSKIKNYEKTSAFRKLQAIMLIGEGENVQTAAKITLYHSNWVYELVKQFCTQSFEEFVKEKRGGANHRNLTEEQETEIIKKFEKKAINGRVVNLSEIKKEYEQVRGKETANSTFYSFLKRMTWRRVMPRGQHPKKASDEVIETSKKLTFNSKR
jgi:transposase